MTFRVEYRRYVLPFRAAVRTAHGNWTQREGVLVRLEAESGFVGYGEAAPVPGFGTETVEQDVEALQALGDRMEGPAIDALPRELGCLGNALRAALKDATATALESGVEATQERNYWPVAALLPAGRAVLGQLASKADAGFRTFKWKVGVGDVADELGLLDDVCAALPTGAKLRLDANGAWERRSAERWLERCADRPVEFVEQPIAPSARGSEDLLMGLAADYPTPLALDESIVGNSDLERWLGNGWRGIFVVKPSLLGEVERAIAALEKAKAEVVFSSALEGAVAARLALEAAWAWRGTTRALGFGVWPLFADRRFDGPAAAPFLRKEDLLPLNPEAVWNALS